MKTISTSSTEISASAQYRVRRCDAGLVAGIQPRNCVANLCGYPLPGRGRCGGAHRRSGSFRTVYARRGAPTGSVIADQLDGVNFPRSGYFCRRQCPVPPSTRLRCADDIRNKSLGPSSPAPEHERQKHHPRDDPGAVAPGQRPAALRPARPGLRKPVGFQPEPVGRDGRRQSPRLSPVQADRQIPSRGDKCGRHPSKRATSGEQGRAST
ncbi:MAG: hypothetical protein MZV70_58850 [Desulfobacterales bacterium]|nr:hypothetical protein [Desulfobacterales bacterium]